MSLPLGEPSSHSTPKQEEEDDDCIVWDESGNIDLRKVASPSYEAGILRQTPTQNRQRKDDALPSATNKDTSRAQPTSSEIKKREKKSEQEIDMIWSRLQAEDPNQKTSRPLSSSDTPQRGNLAISHAVDNVTHENRWGLVKGRRRRAVSSMSMLTRTSYLPKGSSNVDMSNNSKRRLSGDDAFADLLAHLKTPDRDERMPPPNKTRKSLSSLPDVAAPIPPTPTGVAESRQPGRPFEASPDPFGAFPEIDFEEMDRKVNISQSNLDREKHLFAQNANSINLPQRQKSIVPETLSEMPTVPKQNVDSVLRPNTLPPQHSTSRVDSCEQTTRNLVKSNGSREVSQRNSNSVEEDDPFGNFPIQDFEIIEESIAKAKEEERSTTAEDDPFGEFPDIDFDSIDIQIATAANQVPPIETGLARYRVLKVSVDPNTFTKILEVARWKDEMYDEFEDRLAIHTERKSGFPVAKQWNLDGILYLRGEWFHTEAEEGDFVHVYSLYGRANTSNLPVTLDTGANPETDDLVFILHPETLLVPTTISETMQCTRRAVLKNRLGSSGTNRALLFGTLRHQLFEETLRTLDFSPGAVRDRIDSIVRDASVDIVGCSGITSNAVKTELFKVVPQIKRFVQDFTSLSSSLQQQPLARLDSVNGMQSFYLRASGVDAIEEKIVSPEMGIKGDIDLVMQATVSRNLMLAPNPTELVCVELKTGHNQRPDQAHMAQLVLYNLMLKARYGSGKQTKANPSMRASEVSILLYLNSESIKAGNLSPSVAEIKSLIGQRNLVAVKQKQVSDLRGVELRFEKDSTWPTVTLLKAPPPRLPSIENPSMCERCYMARECSLYALLDGDKKAQPRLLQQYTGHLSDEELAYFAHWDRLIDFEASATVRSVAIKWLRNSSDQEASSRTTVSSLVIKKTENLPRHSRGNENFTLVSFQRAPNARHQFPFTSLVLSTGSVMVVSTDGETTGETKQYHRPRMFLARGVLQEISETELVLRMSESDIARIWRNVADITGHSIPTFRLDRDDIATGLGTMRRNLITLLTGDKSPEAMDHPLAKRLPKLREAILCLREPQYREGDSQKILFSPTLVGDIPELPCIDLFDMFMEFQDMNEDQRQAILKVMTAKDYSLIQGFPGSGKTSTISFLVRLLVAHGKRVLVTSYTHSAVDNVLMKLVNHGMDQKQSDSTTAVLRIGDPARCHPRIQHLVAENVALEKEGQSTDNRPPSAESLRFCMTRARVVCVTALTIPGSSLLAGEQFDVVIVDEAGQISQPAILGALIAADTFVLVGDHMQLPPVVVSELAEQGGFGVSMLKRLAEVHPKHVAQLTYQYRMAEDICKLTNDIAYSGKLKCASDVVRLRRLKLEGYPENVAPGVITQALNPGRACIFLDTDILGPNGEFVSYESSAVRKEGGALINKVESELVQHLVQALLSCSVSASSIGVISPFNAQIKLLESCPKIVGWKRQGLECSTIDRYQGRDKPVIIISFVRSNVKGKVGRLLADFRRLNVAVSRAECKLLLVGSLSTLRAGSEVLRPALDRLNSTNSVLKINL